MAFITKVKKQTVQCTGTYNMNAYYSCILGVKGQIFKAISLTVSCNNALGTVIIVVILIISSI